MLKDGRLDAAEKMLQESLEKVRSRRPKNEAREADLIRKLKHIEDQQTRPIDD